MAAIFGATGSLLLTLPGLAQTPTALPQSQAEFEKQVGITPDQKKKIEAVGNKYKPQVDKIQNKYKPQVEKIKQQMQALQVQMQGLQQKYMAEVKPIANQQEKDIENILTPQQREKVKQIQAAMQQQRNAMGGAGLMGGGGAPVPRP
jgi:chromosome segregation ATPase